MSYLSDLLGDAYREGMTEEEMSEALESAMTAKKETESAEITKLKNALSKSNSQAAGYKKELRAKMSQEEAEAETRREEMDKILKENEDLKRNIALADNKNRLLAMGYDDKLAGETAEAMVDGDMAKILESQSKFLEAQKKAIMADKMKSTPRPGAGEGDSAMDYTKEIEAARSRGDLSAVAYYMRLQQQFGAE